MNELIEKRTYTSKTIDNGDGTFTLNAHVDHIHYRDDEGHWQESDVTLDDKGSFFEMTKHSYRLRVAKDFSAPQLMQYLSRYEGANHSITYEPVSLAWYNPATNNVQVFRTQQAVAGVYDPVRNSVYFSGAFGPGIDFEVTVKRLGFTKEVVIPSRPANFPTPPTANHRLVALFRYSGTAMKVKTNRSEWDRNAHFEADEAFELQEEANEAARSFIQPARAYDANGKFIKLKVAWRRRNNQLWQIKEIPLKQMEGATFPVRFDTTTSFYAGSADHDQRWYQANSWSETRSGASGSALVGANILHGENAGGSDKWIISRFFFPFDTSAIGVGATITAATFRAYKDSNTGNGGELTYPANIALVEGTFSNPLSISSADWNSLGTTRLADTDILRSNTSAGYKAWVLNAAGRAVINPSGWTKLALRPSNDLSDATPPTSRSFSRNWYFTETQAGTGTDPYLEVTYTPAAGGNTANFFPFL